MTKGSRIAEGRTAEVFAWGDSQILKLFRSWCPASLAEQEANAAQAVQRTGLSVPSVAGLIEVDGRPGIVFERITGSSMFREFPSRPWKLIHYARLLAELHTSMHTHQVSGLPSLRQRLERRIRSVTLSTRIKDATLSALDRLPDGHALCHGDFHPGNILMTSRGPVIVDWLDAAQGNPLADVARTSLLARVAELPPGTARRWVFQSARTLFHRIYLRRYLERHRASRGELDAWLLPVAVARVSEDIPAERRRLAALIDMLLRRRQRGNISTNSGLTV